MVDAAADARINARARHMLYISFRPMGTVPEMQCKITRCATPPPFVPDREAHNSNGIIRCFMRNESVLGLHRRFSRSHESCNAATHPTNNQIQYFISGIAGLYSEKWQGRHEVFRK